jgi:hypothetical protein
LLALGLYYVGPHLCRYLLQEDMASSCLPFFLPVGTGWLAVLFPWAEAVLALALFGRIFTKAFCQEPVHAV